MAAPSHVHRASSINTLLDCQKNHFHGLLMVFAMGKSPTSEPDEISVSESVIQRIVTELVFVTAHFISFAVASPVTHTHTQTRSTKPKQQTQHQYMTECVGRIVCLMAHVATAQCHTSRTSTLAWYTTYTYIGRCWS